MNRTVARCTKCIPKCSETSAGSSDMWPKCCWPQQPGQLFTMFVPSCRNVSCKGGNFRVPAPNRLDHEEVAWTKKSGECFGHVVYFAPRSSIVSRRMVWALFRKIRLCLGSAKKYLLFEYLVDKCERHIFSLHEALRSRQRSRRAVLWELKIPWLGSKNVPLNFTGESLI